MKYWNVIKIDYEQTKDWILKKHYAKRMPPINYAFGFFIDSKLQGIVTYGIPSSSPLRCGICGEKYKDFVLELNRLVINEQAPENTASLLISQSIKMLPRNSIIISYADTSMGHVGYPYQATNFIYTGLSEKRTDWKVKGMENLHGQTIADISRGKKDRSKFMREKYGDDFYIEERSRKHRYIYFKNKKMKKYLKYPILDYPKGDTNRYDCEDINKSQMTLCGIFN